MLVGRDIELATISELIGGIDAQTPFVLGISGAAGSGRSALLEQARRLATKSGATVLAARGSRDSIDVAFGGLLTLLRPLHNDLAELAGDLVEPLRGAMAMSREQVDPLHVRLAVFRVLTVAAERQPITVVLDDADHLDGATIDALRFAFGRLGVDRVGAITSSQDTVGPFDGVATHRLMLGPLSVDMLAGIVETHARCTADVARTCAMWAAGSPLAAIDLVRSLTDDERGGTAPIPNVPRPTTRVVENLQAELDALSEDARRALVVVAADRSGSTRVVGAALAALGEPSHGLDEAESHGVVVVEEDTVAFRHPLLRPLSYRLLAAPSRRAAHRAVATALVEPQQAVERAWQLVASCAGPDDEVAGLLDLVATDAMRRGAPAEAAATFERAARLTLTEHARLDRLRRAAVGQLDALAFDEALRLADEGASAGDAEAALLALEAIERRDGAPAALASLSSFGAPAVVRADLLLASGRVDGARMALRDHHDDEGSSTSALCAAVKAALDGSGAVQDAGSNAGDSVDPIARRARRRWLDAAATRGVAPDAPATVDELLAATRAAQVNGRLDEARASCERAAALLPPSCGALQGVVTQLATSLEQVAPDPVLSLLTPAERRVAEAVADGRTNREVADHLFLSVKTVDFHLQSVYRKLQVRSRTELALRLARGGRT